MSEEILPRRHGDTVAQVLNYLIFDMCATVSPCLRGKLCLAFPGNSQINIKQPLRQHHMYLFFLLVNLLDRLLV